MSRTNWYKKLKAMASKAVEYFVPPGTPAETSATVSPIYIDNITFKPRIYSTYQKTRKREWTYCMLNYESGEVLFTVSAGRIKDAKHKAWKLYKQHYAAMSEFPEAFWESLTNPILIGCREVAE